MKVLVTGGNGFLGSFVCEALRRQAWCTEVIAPPSSEYDLRVPEQVKKIYGDLHPDGVIHLAGVVGGIGANREHPGRFFYENLMMGTMLMHEAYKSGVKKFLALGTVCAYPKFATPPFKEDEIWNGYPEETNAPYGLAKKMLLVQARAYRQEYGFNAIYLLPVNLYGPGDNFDPETSHVIPALIRKFSEAKEQGHETVTLWGDGTPTREFLYVEDAAEGIALAFERYDGPEAVNLGSGREISIRDLAALIAKEIGYTGSVVWDASKPNGQPRRSLDVSRAKKYFDFASKTDFQEGITKTVEFFTKERSRLREVRFDPVAL